jgi:hypothetical protein
LSSPWAIPCCAAAQGDFEYLDLYHGEADDIFSEEIAVLSFSIGIREELNVDLAEWTSSLSVQKVRD